MPDYRNLNLGGGYGGPVTGSNGQGYEDYVLRLLGGGWMQTLPYQMPDGYAGGIGNGRAPSASPGGLVNNATAVMPVGADPLAHLRQPGDKPWDGTDGYTNRNVASGPGTPIAPYNGFNSDWYNNAFNNPAGQVATPGVPTATGTATAVPDWLAGYTGNNVLTGAGSMTAADVMRNTGGATPAQGTAAQAPLVGDAANLSPADAWKYFYNKGTGW